MCVSAELGAARDRQRAGSRVGIPKRSCRGGGQLTGALTHDAIERVITTGRNDMPPCGAALAADPLQEVTRYVRQIAAQNPPP